MNTSPVQEEPSIPHGHGCVDDLIIRKNQINIRTADFYYRRKEKEFQVTRSGTGFLFERREKSDRREVQ